MQSLKPKVLILLLKKSGRSSGTLFSTSRWADRFDTGLSVSRWGKERVTVWECRCRPKMAQLAWISHGRMGSCLLQDTFDDTDRPAGVNAAILLWFWDHQRTFRRNKPLHFFGGVLLLCQPNKKKEICFGIRCYWGSCVAAKTHIWPCQIHIFYCSRAGLCLNEQDINPDSDRILIITLKKFVQSVCIQPDRPPLKYCSIYKY